MNYQSYLISIIFAAKIIVATGYNRKNNDYYDVKETEIIDLVNPSNECQPWANHPVGTSAASGGILDNSLLICGGYTWSLVYSYTDKCFVIDQSNSNEGTQKLPTKSGSSGSTVINQTLFMTGGINGKSI